MKVQVLLTLSLLCCANVQSAKILGIFPLAAPSHYILGSALMRGLAEKGHDVTMISAFSEKDPPKNGSYRDIVLTGFREDHEKMVKEMNIFELDKKFDFAKVSTFFNKMLEQTEKVLNHTNVQEFLKADEKFDAVIVEQFLNEAHKAFADHFKAPLILLSTIGASGWVNNLVANPSPLSYIPDPVLGLNSDMAFFQRVLNSVMYVFNNLFTNLFVFPQQNQLIKKYFPNAPELEDIIYNTSIILLNSHPSTNQPVPYVPNMIDIGGFHIKPPKKLPKDLQKFLDESKEGVIYFSLGSNIKSTSLPLDKREALLKAFGKLKMKVLWKWEEDVLPGQPPNVKLSKWLPQQDILAHPNIKLFISHGGLLSTLETIYHGKQVLAIPVAGDQKLNAQTVTNQGFGLMINFQDLTEEILTKQINELLTNPKYAENAKERSKFFHDRLVPPLETAVYWVEYVLRHKGAPHLRVAGLDLPWYKYQLLDVIAFLCITSLVAIFVSCYICKKLLNLLCKRKQEKIKRH